MLANQVLSINFWTTVQPKAACKAKFPQDPNLYYLVLDDSDIIAIDSHNNQDGSDACGGEGRILIGEFEGIIK